MRKDFIHNQAELALFVAKKYKIRLADAIERLYSRKSQRHRERVLAACESLIVRSILILTH
jgi:hypothetical protein